MNKFDGETPHNEVAYDVCVIYSEQIDPLLVVKI